MVVEFCDVKFLNNPNKVFYSGQTLTGVVEMDLKEKMKVKKIYLTIQGIAKCQWTDTGEKKDSEGKPRTRIIKFAGKQIYLNSITNLVEKDEELSPGKRQWDFMCQLPLVLPSSTTEKYGSIAYKVVVTIERPWKFNLEHTVDFTVIKPFSLSSKPALKEPTQKEISRTFLTGIVETKPIKAFINLPATGFVPGSSINMKIEIENPTLFDVKHLRVSLIKVTDHKSETPYQEVYRTNDKVEKVTAGRPFSSGNRKYEINFHIPETVVPSITDDTCAVLNISYLIRVKVKLLKCFKSPIAEFPIYIGTVPFMEAPHNGTTPQRAASIPGPSAPYPELPTCPYPAASSPPYPLPPTPANQSFGSGKNAGTIGFIVS